MLLYLTNEIARYITNSLIEFSEWAGNTHNEESKSLAFIRLSNAAFSIRKKKNKREYSYLMKGAYVLMGDKTKPQTLYLLYDFRETCILEQDVVKELDEATRPLQKQYRINGRSARKIYAPAILCEIYKQFVELWIARQKALILEKRVLLQGNPATYSTTVS